MSVDGTPPSADPLSFLKLIAEASAVFVGITFVAGWSYLASYYKTFGLNPVELDIPVPVVSTIALHMLYDAVWPLPLLALLLAAFAVIAHRVVRGNQGWGGWVVAALILSVFLFASAALFRGRHNANIDMLVESPNLPYVAFASRAGVAGLGPPQQPSCVAFETFGDMNCKLLLHSRDAWYFFRPIRESMSQKADKVDIFVILQSDILEVHLQRGINLAGVHP